MNTKNEDYVKLEKEAKRIARKVVRKKLPPKETSSLIFESLKTAHELGMTHSSTITQEEIDFQSSLYK